MFVILCFWLKSTIIANMCQLSNKIKMSVTETAEAVVRKCSKETPTAVFSCEYCKFLITPSFTKHLWWLIHKGDAKLYFVRYWRVVMILFSTALYN